MANKTITSANAVFTLLLPDLYPVPQTLEGFAADAAFDTDSVSPVETRMGVDGKMSAGFTPFIIPQTISFQPDSDSIAIFDFWITSMMLTRDVYFADGTILLPGTGKSYVFKKGALVNAKPLPDAKKVLEPQIYTIHWESYKPALV